MKTDRQKLDLCRLVLAFVADRLSILENDELQKLIDKIDHTIKETKPEESKP